MPRCTAHYLVAYGTGEQKQEWLPKVASGEVVAAVAMTEPGTGSDLQSITTKAIRDGDDYVVNGAKTFITFTDLRVQQIYAGTTEIMKEIISRSLPVPA